MQLLGIISEPECSAIGLKRLEQEFAGISVSSGSIDAALPLLAEAEALVTIGPALRDRAGEVFAATRKLRWVQSIGTGTDNILGHPALPPGVAVTNMRGAHGNQMSEAALAVMLAFSRDLPRVLSNQALAKWDRFAPRLLAGTTVGILGLGAIASTLAPRCKAMGMTVVGISATPRAVEGFDRVEPRDRLCEAVADLDFLVLLVPHSPETHHIIDAAVLAAMKPGAFLVNLARGGILDEDALLAALDAGTIAGAALDVFAREPLPSDSPFWRHPKVIVTPHLGGFHAGYPDQVYRAVADNLGRFLVGGVAALHNRVDGAQS